MVSVERSVAIARAMARNGMPQDAVERRLDGQLTNDERLARAVGCPSHVVINNNGTDAYLLEQLAVHWAQL